MDGKVIAPELSLQMATQAHPDGTIPIIIPFPVLWACRRLGRPIDQKRRRDECSNQNSCNTDEANNVDCGYRQHHTPTKFGPYDLIARLTLRRRAFLRGIFPPDLGGRFLSLPDEGRIVITD